MAKTAEMENTTTTAFFVCVYAISHLKQKNQEKEEDEKKNINDSREFLIHFVRFLYY